MADKVRDPEPSLGGGRFVRPPVVEALAEIFFVGSKWDLTIPGLFYERVRERFPVLRQRQAVTFEIPIGTGSAPTATRAPDRAQFEAADGSRIVQVAQDLLVVNRLRPYGGFDEWKPDLLMLLDLYREMAQPEAFSRVGVRYVNKISMPEEQVDLQSYFRLYPAVPPELGSSFGPFLLRVETRPSLHSDHVLIATTGTTQTDDGEGALLLDLYDILQTDKGSLDDIVRIVDEGHENVGHAFEYSVTDAARSLFGEVSGT